MAEPSTPRPAPGRRRTLRWRNPVLRGWVWQGVALAAVVAVLAWLAGNTRANMAARGIQSGFDFLQQTAGFDIGERPIAYESVDTVARALLVGVLNTLRVALPGIVLVTILGTALGVARFARHAWLRGLAYGMVELFRNVPLLVQLLLWYVLVLEALPEGQAPWSIAGVVLLSRVGLALPWPVSGEAGWHWSVPVAEGFSYAGGLLLSPEYLTVLVGLVAYTTAFVAEVVRGGIASVPAGQREAAQSIGLSGAQQMRWVVLPQALRVIVPPLTSQYLNLTKNSSLAVAVGYPDVVSVTGTVLNQTGRAVECIAIVMAVYLLLSLLTAWLMNRWNRRVAIRER